MLFRSDFYFHNFTKRPESRKFLNLAHYFPYYVKLRLLAHSRSFLANEKARNAIVGAENLLNKQVAIWRENMLGYLSADIICSEKRTVFRERSSRKTVSYEEQMMSKDKCPSIFSPHMGAIVFIILQIFFATRAIFKIGEYSWIFPRFSWGIFAGCQVTNTTWKIGK